jgi:hypothetical protein
MIAEVQPALAPHMAAGRVPDETVMHADTTLRPPADGGAKAKAERSAPALAEAPDVPTPTGDTASPAPQAPPKPQAAPPQAPPQTPQRSTPAALPSFLNLPDAAVARAERALAGLTPATAVAMTEADLRAALKHLAAGTLPTGDEATALKAIYAALPDDPDFAADDAKRRDALAERIMASPFIRDWRERWAHRDRAGRREHGARGGVRRGPGLRHPEPAQGRIPGDGTLGRPL